MRFAQNRTSNSPGLSLVELLIVMTVLSILMAFTVPSLITLRSASLSGSGIEFANFLHLCRSEAISERTAVRLGVVVNGPDENELYRKYGVWKWNKRSREFELSSNWYSLPSNVVFEPLLPVYIANSAYAEEEGSAIRGDYGLDPYLNEFDHVIPGDTKPRTFRYIQFSPAGRASLPGGEQRNIIFVMRSGEAFPEGDPPEVRNWFQFSVDTLTGRTRVYRP